MHGLYRISFSLCRFKTIRQKLASYLLRLYKQQQQTHITLDPFTTGISDYFGVSRPSLARELAHMQEDGLLIADRKHIYYLQERTTGTAYSIIGAV